MSDHHEIYGDLKCRESHSQ